MSKGEYLRTAMARAQRNLEAPMEDLLAEAKSDDEAQRALIVDCIPDEETPTGLGDRETLAEKGHGFFRPLDGAETVRFAKFVACGPGARAVDASELFAIVTQGPGGTVQRSFWRASERVRNVLIDLGAAEPGMHRRLGSVFACCKRLSGQPVE